VGTELDARRRTLPVRFRVDNIRRDLFAGTQTLAYLIADEPVLTTAVPADAVVDDAGVDVVYVQTGGESFERRPVRLGIRDGDLVEVTEGVSPGEWVVARGAYSVKLASTSTESIGHGHAH
jgi:multidrug efflux pump subunit AcrA (membrane-fusion protein)